MNNTDKIQQENRLLKLKNEQLAAKVKILTDDYNSMYSTLLNLRADYVILNYKIEKIKEGKENNE